MPAVIRIVWRCACPGRHRRLCKNTVLLLAVAAGCDQGHHQAVLARPQVTEVGPAPGNSSAGKGRGLASVLAPDGVGSGLLEQPPLHAEIPVLASIRRSGP